MSRSVRAYYLVPKGVSTGRVDAALCAQLCHRARYRPINWDTARIERTRGVPYASSVSSDDLSSRWEYYYDDDTDTVTMTADVADATDAQGF